MELIELLLHAYPRYVEIRELSCTLDVEEEGLRGRLARLAELGLVSVYPREVALSEHGLRSACGFPVDGRRGDAVRGAPRG